MWPANIFFFVSRFVPGARKVAHWIMGYPRGILDSRDDCFPHWSTSYFILGRDQQQGQSATIILVTEVWNMEHEQQPNKESVMETGWSLLITCGIKLFMNI